MPTLKVKPRLSGIFYKSVKSDLVVYSEGLTHGTVMFPAEEDGRQFEIGDYQDNWIPFDNEEEWTPLVEDIVLSNNFSEE